MKTRAFGFGLVIVLATAVSGLAETFPLTFKVVEKEKLRAFPGSYGNYGQLRVQKPSGVKKEPKPVSKTPLYAECSGAQGTLLARVDEAEAGKGYNRLILDLNQNGDLTDDPVATTAMEEGEQSERMLEFGPIKAPAAAALCGGVPQLAAQVYVVNAEYLRSGEDRANIYAGQVMLRAAWYLSATAKINGRSYNLGVYDGDCNFKLGNAPRFSTYKREGQPENWYISGGDTLLADMDGSGTFDADRFNSETVPLAPVIYLDQVPYTVSLAKDNTSVTIAKWSDKLAEVTIEPKGAHVGSVNLAWQRGKDDWALLRPAVINGKFKVPPGNYRLFNCTLIGERADKTPIMAMAYDRIVRDLLRFESAKANRLRCGGPLDVKVTAEKRQPRPSDMGGMQRVEAGSSDSVLAINANVFGAGGEGYSSYATGKGFRQNPDKPTFVVADAKGAKIAEGNLEYG